MMTKYSLLSMMVVSKAYVNQEIKDQFRGIGDKERKALVDAVDSQDSVSSHVCMAMLQVGAH